MCGFAIFDFYYKYCIIHPSVHSIARKEENVPKIYAPRLVREARIKLKDATASYLWRRLVAVKYTLPDLEDLRRRQAKAQDGCEWTDKRIRECLAELTYLEQKYLVAGAELRELLKTHTDRQSSGPTEEFTIASEDLEQEAKWPKRIPKRGGFHQDYRPTRQRYWRPTNNNWKKHRQKRWHTPGVSFKGVE